MDITAFNLVVNEIFCKLFSHAFCQCGNQHPFMVFGAYTDLPHQVINLVQAWANLNNRIEQSRGPDQLFNDHSFAFLQFKISRCGAYKDGLVDQLLKFIKFKRPVVDGCRQPESIFDQGLLARMIAPLHGPYLRYGDVAFINEGDEIVRKIIEQAERPVSRRSSVKVP